MNIAGDYDNESKDVVETQTTEKVFRLPQTFVENISKAVFEKAKCLS